MTLLAYSTSIAKCIDNDIVKEARLLLCDASNYIASFSIHFNASL